MERDRGNERETEIERQTDRKLKKERGGGRCWREGERGWVEKERERERERESQSKRL